jgi:hypothetical protein
VAGGIYASTNADEILVFTAMGGACVSISDDGMPVANAAGCPYANIRVSAGIAKNALGVSMGCLRSFVDNVQTGGRFCARIALAKLHGRS